MPRNPDQISKSPLAYGKFEWDLTKPAAAMNGGTRLSVLDKKRFNIQGTNGEDFRLKTAIMVDHPETFLEVLTCQQSLYLWFTYGEKELENRIRFKIMFWKKDSSKSKLYWCFDSTKQEQVDIIGVEDWPDMRVKLYRTSVPFDISSKKKELQLELQVEIMAAEPKPMVSGELTSVQDLSFLQDDEPTMIQKLSDLHLNESLSDMKIMCDNVEFPCHKVILSSRSEVFKTMFNVKESKENQEGFIKIDDVSAETMRTFLKFLYKDELKPEEIDCNLMIAAEKYDFKRLYNICSKYLEKKIDANSVMETTVTAYLVDDKHLLQKASNFIFKNRGSIRRCQIWDQIKSKHPGIAAKVMDLMVFDTEKESSENPDQ